MVKPSSLSNVAVAVVNGVTPFELGIFCEVFGIDRSGMGLPTYDFALCAMEGNPITAGDGHYSLTLPHGPERLEEADLICLPADRGAPTRVYPESLLEALRRGVDRGARVLSVCSGAFMLGAAGLLDDRRCTTHWMHAPTLARRFPRAKVDPDVLYVDEGQVITSAGTASGIDACLHLVRQEQGAEVANTIARRMVVPPHRDGGQAQYIQRPLPRTSCDTVGEVIGWMARHLEEEITVEQLAERAHMSARTFARRFLAGDGDHPVPVGAAPAGPAGAGAAGGHRRDGGRDRGALRVRHGGRSAPPLPADAGHHPERLPPHVPGAGRGLKPPGEDSPTLII